MKRLLFLIILIELSSCTSSQLISYNYIDSVSNQMNAVLNNLEKSSFAIKNGKKSEHPFALVNHCDGITTLVFNYIENMPESIRAYIKKSKRVIKLQGETIPLIFYFDDGNSAIRKGGISLGIIGGYLIQFNESGEILMTGPVY